MTSSLYDDAGGLDGLRRLSNAFYERVLADELLAPVFAHFTPAHVEHVAVWLAEVFGGLGSNFTAHRWAGTRRCCAATWASRSATSTGSAGCS